MTDTINSATQKIEDAAANPTEVGLAQSILQRIPAPIRKNFLRVFGVVGSIGSAALIVGGAVNGQPGEWIAALGGLILALWHFVSAANVDTSSTPAAVTTASTDTTVPVSTDSSIAPTPDATNVTTPADTQFPDEASPADTTTDVPASA